MKIEIDYEESQRVSEILHTVGKGPLREFTITLGHKPRAELHLTDDLYCWIKAYCRIKLGLEAQINRRTSAIFLRGILYDALFKLPFNSTEVGLQLDGCSAIGHPDVVESNVQILPDVPCPSIVEDSQGIKTAVKVPLNDLHMYPIEAKHTTQQIRNVEDIPGKWLHQLKLEMVYCNSLVGYLAIGEIMSTMITMWKSKMTKLEFEGVKIAHVVRMNFLNNIIEAGHLKNLKPIREECMSCFYNYDGGCPRRPGE